jgi:quinol monooxygenase YgiN
MLHVVATIEVHEGKRGELLRVFETLTPLVRAEQGCIEYVATIDVQTAIKVQVPPRPNVVTVVEKWESIEALTAHLAATHMQTYREDVKDIVKSVALQVLAAA